MRKPPGVPCPDPNKHCGDLEPAAACIENYYIAAFIIIAILIYIHFKNKKSWGKRHIGTI